MQWISVLILTENVPRSHGLLKFFEFFPKGVGGWPILLVEIHAFLGNIYQKLSVNVINFEEIRKFGLEIQKMGLLFAPCDFYLYFV